MPHTAMSSTCELCAANLVYCASHDGYFCAPCDRWAERPCAGPHCSYCQGRPSKPSGCEHCGDHHGAGPKSPASPDATAPLDLSAASVGFDADAYQQAARRTAIYPGLGDNVYYPVLGLCGEVSEVLEKVLAGAGAAAVVRELGDALWYVSQVCYELGLPLSELAADQEAARASAERAGAVPGLPGSAALAALACVDAGKVAERAKKALRDTDGHMATEALALVSGYLSELLGALAALSADMGGSLAATAQTNLAKLAQRADQGLVRGDGDDREAPGSAPAQNQPDSAMQAVPFGARASEP